MKFQFAENLTINSDLEPWKSEGIRIGFYSAPGTRKSYTVAASIVEPFLDEGGAVVIFEPRSEWHTLKQHYESVLVVGGPFKDIPLAVNHARVYAEAVVKHGASMVFDFSETEQTDLVTFAAELLARLFTLQNVVRRPLLLFIEEAADYCPLSTKGKSVPPWIYARMIDRIEKIATQGRPLGFMLTMTSQRPAQLNYTVRMMCNLSFYGKFHPKDLNDIKEVLKPYDVPNTETAEKCVNMPHGSWLAITAEAAQYTSMKVTRKTPHGADTPTLEYEAARTDETKQTIGQLTAIIQDAMEKDEAEKSELDKAKREIKSLTKRLEAAEEKARIKLSVQDMLKGDGGAEELAQKLAKAEEKVKDQKFIIADLEGQVKLLEKYKVFDQALTGIIEAKLPTIHIPQGNPQPEFETGSTKIVHTKTAPQIKHHIEYPIIKTNEKTYEGRLITLAMSPFFKEKKTAKQVQAEIERVFAVQTNITVLSREIPKLVKLKILQREKDSSNTWVYWLVPGAQERIKECSK